MKNASLNSGRVSAAAILTLVAFIIITAIAAMAQSGRRVRKSTPVPLETPTASPTPTPKKSPEKPALPVFVGVNAYDLRANVPLYFSESVAKSCAERLSRNSSVRVELGSRDVTRGDAIKKAKEAKTGFVVLLELRRDRMREDRDAELSLIYIEYSVYSAGTAKQVTSGDVHQQAVGYRDILGRGDSVSVAEARLKLAARIAGDRIVNALMNHVP